MHAPQSVPLKPGAQVAHRGASQPVLGVCVHVLPAPQVSNVQGSPSWQFVTPAQRRLAQTSPVVQALPSSHVAVLAVERQIPPAQLSVVHGLLSVQSFALPAQTVPVQVSANVQALPSSHVTAIGR